MRLSDLSFKIRFALIGLVVLAAFATLIFVGGQTLLKVMVNGEIYREVVADKDLSTVLTPPLLDLGPTHRLSGAATMAKTHDERMELMEKSERAVSGWRGGYTEWDPKVVDRGMGLRKALFTDAKESGEAYLAKRERTLVPLLKAEPYDREKAMEAMDSLETEFNVHRGHILRSATILQDRVKKQEEHAAQAAADGEKTAIWVAILSVAAVMLIGGLLLRSVLKSIATVSGRMKEMAEKDADLSARIAVSSKDEVGELARWVNQFLEKISGLVRTVKKSTIQLRSAVTQMAATAREQGETVSSFGAGTAEVAAATKEISATGAELTTTMGEVDRVAKDTAGLAEGGRDSLAEMRETMGQLASSSGQISQRLSAINEKARDITGVVTTITKVADQTNLLSVNAAIEAEKAGEYGRGFLVVAREIRRLADQTASATLDIERTVAQMQGAVSAGVMEMDKFSEQVRRTVAEVESVSSGLDRIIGQVQILTQRFDQVSGGMKAQAQGAQQINEAMGSLSENVKQTSRSLGEFTSATEEMKTAVEAVKQELGKFKVED